MYKKSEGGIKEKKRLKSVEFYNEKRFIMLRKRFEIVK